MKNLYWKVYVCLIILITVLSIFVVCYVKGVLNEYESSQPERLVETQLDVLKTAAKKGNLENVIDFPDIEQAAYDIPIVEINKYVESLKNVNELTYKVKTGVFSETGQSYQVLADGNPIAIIDLESDSEKTKLAILKIMNWNIKSITPVIKLSTYEYQINVPVDFEVFINGTKLDKFEYSDTDGLKKYSLDKLYSEPEIIIKDIYGYTADFDIVNNIVTPIVHTYLLNLSNGFNVFAGDAKIDGIHLNNVTQYSITTACDALNIVDKYGNTTTYTGVEDICSYNYEIDIPSNFDIKADCVDINSCFVKQVDNPKYQYCLEYEDMPKNNIYLINDVLKKPVFEILDNLGNVVDYTVKNGKIVISDQVGFDKIPEWVNDEVDVLDLAKKWSLFMTNDLEGDTKGFDTIKKYLLKDSYLYNVAYKWATGVDITFTSKHRSYDNYFENEKVTNFIQYSNKLFSCDISFIKYMYLYTNNIWVDDPMNSTFYFFKCGEGSSAHWVIIDIQEIINSNYLEEGL